MTRPTDFLPVQVLQRAAARVAAQFDGTAVPSRPVAHQRLLLVVLLAVAAALRFWDLGTYGLHLPDEATTALPALHVLQDGSPRFPGGMLYTRAWPQSYLIAASVAVFGQSEWAMRLPSAICGVLLVWLVWVFGRRFLDVGWNLALTATAALLPGLVEDAQVARMYVFMMACLTCYGIFIFRWERSRRQTDLWLAVAVMMLAVVFNHLAIFGSLLLLFPALRTAEPRTVRQTCWALLALALFFVYMRWTGSPYPLPLTDWVVEPLQVGKAPGGYGLRFQPVLSAVAALSGAVGCWLVKRELGSARGAGLVLALLAAAFVLLAGLQDHVGILLLVTAMVVARRQGARSWRAPAFLAGAVVLLLGIQLALVHRHGPGVLRKDLGVLVGQPSVWQYIIVGDFSPVAVLATGLGLVFAVRRLANGERLPEHWLFFLLTVLAPLFALGLTDWYFPPRYTEFAVLGLLLTALAEAQHWQKRRSRGPRWLPAAAVVLLVNPVALADSIRARSEFPDFRAQARFVQSLPLGPRDIVVAEEVLYQWYYLGHVDYWLSGRNVAATFIERFNGVIVDQYVHVPLISSAAELQALIDRPERGAIYIVGSREDSEDGRRYARGPELAPLLESGRFRKIWSGANGLKIWKIDAPGDDRGRVP